MFQVPWFLVELEGDHPKSYEIIHRCDIIERNESNCKVRFKRDQHQFVGYITSASEHRSYVEQVLLEEQQKSNQLGLMASCQLNTKHVKTSKWFVIQYQKAMEQGVVHEVVCKNDLVWTVANGLKTGTGMGEDVFTRDGDVLRLANIIYIAKSYDDACDKMHDIKKKLDGMFFKPTRQSGEWFLLQYSTNRSRILYGIFNKSITLYQKENKNPDFAYIPHADEDAVIQCAVIQQSANIDKLYECLAQIKHACFNIEFIQNINNLNSKPKPYRIPSEERANSYKKILPLGKQTSHMVMHPYAASHRHLSAGSIKTECVNLKSTDTRADKTNCDLQTKSSVDVDVLLKIMNLEKVMFKESLEILNALNDINATKSALEKELQCLELETAQNNTEYLQKFNQPAQTEELEHIIKHIPAIRELQASRVKVFAEENDKNGPLRLESIKTRLRRVADNQKDDCDILSRFNKILSNIKTDLSTISEDDNDDDTTSIISGPSSSGVSSGDDNAKRKHHKCDFVETTDVAKKYPLRIESEPAWVILGSHGTALIARDFDSIPWSVPTTATRMLLTLVFGNDILSTHTLSGKPSPAFHGRERPQKLQLDPLKTADIVHCVRVQCGVNERTVRASITTKCADTAKRYKRRNKDK